MEPGNVSIQVPLRFERGRVTAGAGKRPIIGVFELTVLLDLHNIREFVLAVRAIEILDLPTRSQVPLQVIHVIEHLRASRKVAV